MVEKRRRLIALAGNEAVVARSTGVGDDTAKTKTVR